MKHEHHAEVDVDVDIPTQDLKDLIDKITDSAIKIIAVGTIAQIVKSHLSR